jgi:hypothetical protein
VLRRVSHHRTATGGYVASTASTAPAHPLGYLQGLRGDRACSRQSHPDVIGAVECLVAEVRSVAGRRPITLVLSNVSSADEPSLGILPLASRLLDASIVASACLDTPTEDFSGAWRSALAELGVRRHLPLLTSVERTDAAAIVSSCGVAAGEVLTLVEAGLTNRTIAARMHLSEKTVEGYLTRLLKHYQCTNRTQLAIQRSARPVLRDRPQDPWWK